MKTLITIFKTLVRKIDQNVNGEHDIQITMDLPIPMKNVNYRDQVRIVNILYNIPVNGSFPVKNELIPVVRKMHRDHFPEYKLRIVDFGTSHRVFRRA